MSVTAAIGICLSRHVYCMCQGLFFASYSQLGKEKKIGG